VDPVTFFAIVGVLFGAAIGSFLNVVIWRLPRGESLVSPGSHCPRCNAPIRFYDNIPLLSYLILRGRCRRCGARISPRYFIVELISALFLAGYLTQFGLGPGLAYYLLTAALLVVTAIDLDFKIIPNEISLPGIPIGLAINALVLSHDWRRGLVEGGLGIALGAGALLLVAGGYYLIARREGMGMGDPKLLAMIGAFVGWQGVVFTMLAASCIGTLVGVGLIVFAGKDRRYQVPFGPFLSLGAVLWIWFGPTAWRWYVGGLG
jgi:leader peptidase (prepilin peptidase)/N-methyltransferase